MQIPNKRILPDLGKIMFRKIKNLFAKKETISQEDRDFGLIVFVEDVAKGQNPYWEMQGYIEFPEHNAKIQCVGIPGNLEGPYENARSFLKSKFNSLPQIWELCSEQLIKTINDWYPEKASSEPQEVFTLCSINMDEQEWEVCFESKPTFKWVYLGLQLQGNEIVSATLDT